MAIDSSRVAANHPDGGAARGASSRRIMVQHKFKVNGRYRMPDGRVVKVVLSEVYNLRCFELDAGGNTVGGMIKIHPESELAGKLVAVD